MPSCDSTQGPNTICRACIRTAADWDFPGGPGVKNPPSNAGDVGSIPGGGTKIPHAGGQLSLRAVEPTCHT